ncbi:S-adenosyl-L-methionine-dependent methyltransferase, partial [Myriangium duriaei CBS 260.36]
MSNPTAQQYFKDLSSGYAKSTGNSTYDIIASFLPSILPSLPSGPLTIHDNASGPGTASLALLSLLPLSQHDSLTIHATDISAPMITALKSHLTALANLQATVHPAVLDSETLSFPADIFDLSITNISMPNFGSSTAAQAEILRTLKPVTGLAIASVWKRFTVAEMIHAAQRAIRPDSELKHMPRADYLQKGCLKAEMEAAGFIQVREQAVKIVVKDEGVAQLRDFMLGPFTEGVRKEWSGEENSKWKREIEKLVAEEVDKEGGIGMEAWVVAARKP